jgi:hypothetical protein
VLARHVCLRDREGAGTPQAVRARAAPRPRAGTLWRRHCARLEKSQKKSERF